MICPKCQNQMQTVERRGVHIEQCHGCRGIFLDRGELEQIANAERGYYGTPMGGPAPHRNSDSPPPYGSPQQGGRYRDSPPPYGSPQQGGRYRDSPPPYGARQQGGHHSDSPPPYGHQGSRRRKGFLEGLFD